MGLESLGLAGRGFCPVTTSCEDFKTDVARCSQREGVEAGVRRLRLEAQHIAVGNVVGDRGQIAFETLRVAELEVFATCKPSSGLGDVLLEAVSRGDCGYLGEPKWWRKKAETVPELCDRLFIEVALWVTRVAAHTAMSWARWLGAS